MDWPQTKSWRIDFDYERLLNAESAPSSGKYAAGKQGGMQNEAHAPPPPPCTREHANAHTHKKIEKYTEKISKTIQIFCFFRVSSLGRSFNSSRFGLKCIRPSPHLALTLALTLTLKPPPTPTLTLTLTLNKKTA